MLFRHTPLLRYAPLFFFDFRRLRRDILRCAMMSLYTRHHGHEYVTTARVVSVFRCYFAVDFSYAMSPF